MWLTGSEIPSDTFMIFTVLWEPSGHKLQSATYRLQWDCYSSLLHEKFSLLCTLVVPDRRVRPFRLSQVSYWVDPTETWGMIQWAHHKLATEIPQWVRSRHHEIHITFCTFISLHSCATSLCPLLAGCSVLVQAHAMLANSSYENYSVKTLLGCSFCSIKWQSTLIFSTIQKETPGSEKKNNSLVNWLTLQVLFKVSGKTSSQENKKNLHLQLTLADFTKALCPQCTESLCAAQKNTLSIICPTLDCLLLLPYSKRGSLSTHSFIFNFSLTIFTSKHVPVHTLHQRALTLHQFVLCLL